MTDEERTNPAITLCLLPRLSKKLHTGPLDTQPNLAYTAPNRPFAITDHRNDPTCICPPRKSPALSGPIIFMRVRPRRVPCRRRGKGTAAGRVLLVPFLARRCPPAGLSRKSWRTAGSALVALTTHETHPSVNVDEGYLYGTPGRLSARLRSEHARDRLPALRRLRPLHCHDPAHPLASVDSVRFASKRHPPSSTMRSTSSSTSSPISNAPLRLVKKLLPT